MNRSTMKQITFGMNYTPRKLGHYDRQISVAKTAAVEATYKAGNENAKGLIMGACYGARLGQRGRLDSALRARFADPLGCMETAHSHIDCREAFH